MIAGAEDQPVLEVGQTVWITVGGLLIKSVVTEVEDCFRKRDPNALLFYFVNEPVGHALALDDELFLTKQDAEIWITACKEAGYWPSENGDGVPVEWKTPLEEWRREQMLFIASTHFDMDASKVPEGYIAKTFPTYPPKKFGVDWFFVKDL